MSDSDSVLLRDVVPVDAGTAPGEPVDVLVAEGRIRSIAPRGALGAGDAERVVAGGGRMLLPGFVDAHSHAGLLLGDPDVRLALLRQGVTAIIAGQDGVGPAPGDGAYADEYFAAIDGRRARTAVRDARAGIAGLLADADGAGPVHAAWLVPAGTVRYEVLGRGDVSADAAAIAAMQALVADGLADGAVGLSLGLDYVPGRFASTAELAELARPVAAAGGVVVAHMRGGYEHGSPVGIAELAAISRASGAGVHVSHFHAEPDIVLGLLDGLARDRVDATFDAYPYDRGCSLLGMPLLPAEISALPVDEAVARLSDPAERARLHAEWFPTIVDYPSLGPDWPGMLTLGHLAAPEYAWAHGLTLGAAAARAGREPADFALDVLVACRMEANAVMAVRTPRPDADLARILAHPDAMAGSDGIFIGAHPHPRARGTFPRLISEFVVRRGALTWSQAAALTSRRAVRRFGLGERGLVREGAEADLVLLDPQAVHAGADYDEPLGLGTGIDDVLVAGVPVLAGGALTGANPGRGLRRSAADASVADAPARPSHPDRPGGAR